MLLFNITDWQVNEINMLNKLKYQFVITESTEFKHCILNVGTSSYFYFYTAGCEYVWIDNI